LYSQSGVGSSLGIDGTDQVSTGDLSNLDSGDETEQYDNGAVTPTLSDEMEEDEADRARYNASSPTPSPSLANNSTDPFNFSRMNLGTGPQVSFDPNVLAYSTDGTGGISRVGRAPSIAATAGSSRAPSARGISPISISRATTTEGSSMGEFDSTGTGIGESGIETPSLVRSRNSSYSAPSSEIETMGGSNGMEVGDTNTRSRGATLTANANALSSGGMSVVDEREDHRRDGPSLAPSEAGSDSNRSLAQDSSGADHGAFSFQSSGGIAAMGSQEGSSDRYVQPASMAFSARRSIGTFEPPSLGETAMAKGGSLHPVLPSLLAIKKAGRNNGSGAASTAATAGTASPASSLSIDGDFEEASQTFESSAVE
jgi:hypothetical protein